MTFDTSLNIAHLVFYFIKLDVPKIFNAVSNVWIPNSHLRFLQNKFYPCVQYHNIISFSNLVRFFYHANLSCKWMFLLNNSIVLPFYYMKWSTGGQTSVSLLMLTSTLCVNILFWQNTLQKIVREVRAPQLLLCYIEGMWNTSILRFIYMY